MAQILGNETYSKIIADIYNLAPVNRNSLQAGSNDIYGRIAYMSAVKARGWLNPDIEQTEEIFTKILGDINANRKNADLAAGDAVSLLKDAY